MRIRKGCGCPVGLLGLVNLVYVISAIIGAVSGSTPVPAAMLVLFISLGNLVLCAIVALAAFRGESFKSRAPQDAQDYEGEDDTVEPEIQEATSPQEDE
jgi:hypothetical protein